MRQPAIKFDVYIEMGAKRTFAGAIDWYGWCRSGQDERSALQALFDYAPRYAHVLRAARLGFQVPTGATTFTVAERLKGNTTTDFGSPAIAPSRDTQPVDDAQIRHMQTLLKACWREFDAVVQAARGKELSKGPRGGGRDLEKIVKHVSDADAVYLSRLARRVEEGNSKEALTRTRQAILDALTAATHGEILTRGPRGGLLWTPRYFVRRAAWHVLDHCWEIEDRIK